ncbi:DUF58 domain-containing protein [Guggenheimella bovis]
MITRRFVGWVLTLVLAIFVANLALRSFAHTFVYFLLVLPVVSLLYAFILRRSLQLSFHAKFSKIPRHERGEWVILLKNTSFFTTFYLSLHERLDVGFKKSEYVLEPLSMLELPIYRETDHCGILLSPEVKLFFYDPFGFFRIPLKTLAKREMGDVYVLPRPYEMASDELSLELFSKVGEKEYKRSMSQSDEIEEVRPFRLGDSRKFIHQKLSARVQEWMVREYRETRERVIQVFFSFESLSKEEKKELDFCFDAMSSVLKHLSEKNEKLRVYFHQRSLALELKNFSHYEEFLLNLVREVPPFSSSLDFVEEGVQDLNESVVLFFFTSLKEEDGVKLRALASKAKSVSVIYLNVYDKEPGIKPETLKRNGVDYAEIKA